MYEWIDADAEVAVRIARARVIGFDVIAEETVDIADNGTNDWMRRNDPDNEGYAFNGEHPQRSKLRVETRLKLLSKWASGRYGERIHNEHSGNLTLTANPLDEKL
jgi:hypothetical protein